MGVLDSIKGMFGGGSERSRPPENRMRQPPGKDSPPDGPGPGPDTGPEPGRETGVPNPPGLDERDNRGPAPNEGPGRGETSEPPRREAPSGEGPSPRREGRGSTLDVDRESSNPPTPGQSPNEDLDFEPAGSSRGGPDRGGDPSPPTPPTDRREDRGGGPERLEGNRREEDPAPDMPDQPGDYNLDLPEPREGEDRIDKIEQQNQRIIDLLEDIRDRMGREGGRR